MVKVMTSKIGLANFKNRGFVLGNILAKIIPNKQGPIVANKFHNNLTKGICMFAAVMNPWPKVYNHNGSRT